MYTTYSTAPGETTDETFRVRGKALSDALATVELVKTADTGQIDWATVTRPGATNTDVGYEIWRFDDTLQATYPVYIKIVYGSGNTSSGSYAYTFTFGSGSDGAGNLTGTSLFMGSSFIRLYNYSSIPTAYPCVVSSYAKGNLGIIQYMGSTTYAMFLIIERLKDSNGDPTANGLHVACAAPAIQPTNAPSSITFLKDRFPVPISGAADALVTNLPGTGTGSYDGNWGIYPIFPDDATLRFDLGALIYFTGNHATAGDIIYINVFGGAHRYMTSGAITGTVNGNSTAKGYLVRID